MGFFSDTRAALDLMNAADAINDCIRGTIPYLNKYDIGQTFRAEDRPIIVWIINTVAVLRSTKQKKRALIENSLL